MCVLFTVLYELNTVEFRKAALKICSNVRYPYSRHSISRRPILTVELIKSKPVT